MPDLDLELDLVLLHLLLRAPVLDQLILSCVSSGKRRMLLSPHLVRPTTYYAIHHLSFIISHPSCYMLQSAVFSIRLEYLPADDLREDISLLINPLTWT